VWHSGTVRGQAAGKGCGRPVPSAALIMLCLCLIVCALLPSQPLHPLLTCDRQQSSTPGAMSAGRDQGCDAWEPAARRSTAGVPSVRRAGVGARPIHTESTASSPHPQTTVPHHTLMVLDGDLSERRMFSGFKSRWMMFLECAYAMKSRRHRILSAASFSLKWPCQQHRQQQRVQSAGGWVRPGVRHG